MLVDRFCRLPLPKYGSTQQWQRWIESQLARCDDTEFAKRFAGWVPIAGVPASAYQHRVITVENTKLLCGIRFKGGDPNFPFVDLIACDGEWDGEPTHTWADVIRSEFAEFQPRAMRYAVKPGADFTMSGLPAKAAVDQHFLAGPAVGVGHPSIDVAENLDWFDDYESAFSRWQRKSPIGGEVTPSTREDLESCLCGGRLVVWFDSGRFVGVAACSSNGERSLLGWCIVEEFVVPERQGEGIGTQLQKALIAELERETIGSRAIVWGTIHATNEASIAVATKCGREIVETWLFLPLGDRTDDDSAATRT